MAKVIPLRSRYEQAPLKWQEHVDNIFMARYVLVNMFRISVTTTLLELSVEQPIEIAIIFFIEAVMLLQPITNAYQKQRDRLHSVTPLLMAKYLTIALDIVLTGLLFAAVYNPQVGGANFTGNYGVVIAAAYANLGETIWLIGEEFIIHNNA